MALVIPLQQQRATGERGPTALIVILSKENLDRMREGDPFDMQMKDYHNQINVSRPLGELDLIIAYEEDEQQIRRLAKEGGLPAVIAHIERNRVHRPGDAAPPVSVKPPKVQPQ